MEMKKNKQGQELHVQAVWFAAGTAAFMACLERAVLVSFVEQWRVLVFLALNLLLLAILFTSTHPNCSTDTPETQNNNNVSSTAEEAEVVEMCRKQGSSAEENNNVDEADADEVDLKSADMSKEELNERAEAFIAMFRQHLASDAKIHFGYNKTTTCTLHSPTIKGAHQILSRRRTATPI